jgi:hypothetical protein
MNERIRELAEQAGLHLDKNGDIIWSKTRYNFEVEKFAMLIIEKCGEIADDHSDHGIISYPIDKYFGVE